MGPGAFELGWRETVRPGRLPHCGRQGLSLTRGYDERVTTTRFHESGIILGDDWYAGRHGFDHG